MPLEKLYSVDEAAEALGISHWTIWAKSEKMANFSERK